MRTCLYLLALLLCPLAGAQIKVISLQPIIGDLAENVGGKHITVKTLGDHETHQFDPKPKDLVEIATAPLILASGKHLEDAFIDKVRDNMRKDARLVEVGKRIPSILIDTKSGVFLCCPSHALGTIDPHWWHDPNNMKRAARILADAFAEIDPANKKAYEANARTYGRLLDQLDSWVKKEVAQIPRKQRVLASSHTAFGYFCKAYGFKAVAVQGINQESAASPKYLAEIITTLRKHNVKAVFPEQHSNPKVLQSMVADTGIALGEKLCSDEPPHAAPTYVAMIRHNVMAIVKALK